jgi:2-oxoglutarate ferredoxin oxidoreductase subunit gamma
MAQVDLTIAGLGGQGSILAGNILGTAAVSYGDKYATQTQAYSSELRGGFAATWVIISDNPIVFPRVKTPDILIAQAQDSIERFAGSVKPGGLLIIDSDMVHLVPPSFDTVYAIPGTSIARNQIKAPITANIIMLGALCKVSNILERQPFDDAITNSVPKGKEEMNLKAFDLGFSQVKKRGKS